MPKPISSLIARRIPRLTALLAVLFLTLSAFADPVSGVVTNKTTGKPSPGDDVVLLQLAQGMQELARTKTDAHGRYTLQVPADGLHLLRVTHQGANYFQPVQPGTTTVDMDVYTAAPEVAGISLEADVMRIQSAPGGSGLRVVEHFFVKNDSQPAETLMNAHPFELYLPPGATVEGSAAKSPGGMAVQSALVPESGEPNKYTMIFAIKPGESEFQVTYQLPYSGSFTFQPRLISPADALAVMMPKAMTFKPGPSAPYSPVTEDLGAQTFVARNVQPSQPLEFTITGTGELPRDAAAGATDTSGNTPANTTGSTIDNRPGGGLGTPVDPEATRDPWAKYKWWILAALALLFATGAGLLLRTPRTPIAPAPQPQPNTPAGTLQVLKDELFRVETDRLEGRLTDSQYQELRAAFDLILRRTLTRENQPLDTVTIIPE